MTDENDGVQKIRTGIEGLDEITGGGFPKGRSVLVCGQSGVGKTMLALEFLVRGAIQYGEPGVFLTFEESVEELRANVASLGFDLAALIAQEKLDIDHVQMEPSHVGGVYDLDGLFIRLDAALTRVHARRLALDSFDVLFGALSDPVFVRKEIRRLIGWLKARAISVVITAESGTDALTRNGIEEYISDCVIVMENRIQNKLATRLLRIVKYRGSEHGVNEYPFLIDARGISVFPVTTLAVDLPASSERISSGIADLDAMLGGAGYYRGSSVLISGSPGSGKSTVAAAFAQACCARGERCLYVLLEESRAQLVRNMRSVGIDLEQPQQDGLLEFLMTRPSVMGLETHLANFHQAILRFRPSAVVFDPISALHSIGEPAAIKSLVVRLVNFLKSRQISAQFVTLAGFDDEAGSTNIGLSSMIDSWVHLRDVEYHGERNRVISVLKSRGMWHSNQLREFILTDHGVELCEVVLEADRVLVGSARAAHAGALELAALAREQQQLIRGSRLEKERQLKNAQIAAIEASFAASQAELESEIGLDARRGQIDLETLRKVRRSRDITGGGA
jgi:circadian clock protein KaiC